MTMKDSNSDDPETERAMAKIAEAERKLTSSTAAGFNWLKWVPGWGKVKHFLGDSQDISDACDSFIQAANLLKRAQNWELAGDAFVRCADLYSQEGDYSAFDAATNYSEAGNCYRKVNLKKAIDCYSKAASIYTDKGKFSSEARVRMMIGELHEEEALAAVGTEAKRQATLRAMDQYREAGERYHGEQSISLANKCSLKVATMAAGLGEYKDAARRFEEHALWEAGHPTLRFSSKSSFFHSLLCLLVIDVVDTKHALERYSQASSSFAGSRECEFIRALISCVEEETGPKHFDSLVSEFEKLSRSIDSPWMHTALDKLREDLGGQEEEHYLDADEPDLR